MSDIRCASCFQEPAHPIKSRKTLAGDVIGTFAKDAGLVLDVTDTDCMSQNGSTHVDSFSRLSNGEKSETRMTVTVSVLKQPQK